MIEPNEIIENNLDRSNDNIDHPLSVGIPSTEVDKEIDETIEDCNAVRYTHPIKREFKEDGQFEIEIDFEFDKHHYNLNRGSKLDTLYIEIVGNKISRFSCGNHKLNLALRHAIQLHDGLSTILFNLNKSNSHIRNTIKLNKVKCIKLIFFF